MFQQLDLTFEINKKWLWHFVLKKIRLYSFNQLYVILSLYGDEICEMKG